MRARLMTMLALLTLVVSGCGDDDGDGESGGGTTVASSTPSTAAGKDISGVVLRQSDLPAGWKSEPAEPETAQDEEIDRKFDECLGAVHDPDDDDVTSPTFVFEDTTSVSSTANLLPADEMESDWAAFTGPKLIGCATEAINSALASESGDTAFGPAKVMDLDYPEVGDGSRAVRATATATAEGQEIEVFFDLIFIRQGLVGISLNTFNVDEPFPPDLAAELGQKLADRAAA